MSMPDGYLDNVAEACCQLLQEAVTCLLNLRPLKQPPNTAAVIKIKQLRGCPGWPSSKEENCNLRL